MSTLDPAEFHFYSEMSFRELHRFNDSELRIALATTGTADFADCTKGGGGTLLESPHASFAGGVEPVTIDTNIPALTPAPQAPPKSARAVGYFLATRLYLG